MLAASQDLMCGGVPSRRRRDAIPEELRGKNIWLRWKLEEREGKTTKIPYRSDGSGMAKTNDPSTWSSFEDAVSSDFGNGVGCVVKDGLVCIDLDKVRDLVTGIIEPWAQSIIDECDSYTEISPSKTGVHIWLRGEVPVGGNRRGRMEVYDFHSPRYLTITGDVLVNKSIREFDLTKLHKRMLEGADPEYRAKQEHASVDESAADFSFCRELAKQGKSAVEIDAAMRASSHMRPKWDSARPGGTYGSQTIARAMAGVNTKKQEARRLRMNTALSIEPENITWLWKDTLPIGKLTLFVGQPKKGKSFATVDIAARASKGMDWADGQKGNGVPIRTILVSNEDAANDTIVPRLLAAGADLSKVEIVSGASCGSEDNLVFSLPEDVPSLETALDELPDTKLIIIDPVMNHLGKIDALKDQDMRRALSPLAALAERRQVAIIVVTHFNKSTGGNILDKINGAVAMIGVCRMGWAFVDDENDPKQRLMAMAGTNIASEDTKALSYHFEAKEVVHKAKTLHTAAMMWGDSKTVNIAEVMMANESPKDYKSLRAKKWLPELFADGKPRLSREVYRAGEKLTPPIDVDSIKRVRKALGYGVKEDSSKSWWIVPPNATGEVETEGADDCSDWP